MNLTDTHTHLYWDSFKEDFNEMIQRALDAGVSTIINVGVDVEKSKEAVQVSKKLALSACGERSRTGVEGFSTIGIHPHEAHKYFNNPGVSIQKDIRKLEQIYLSNTKKVIAVGECGLDYLFQETDPHVAPQSGVPRDDKGVIASEAWQSVDQIKNLQRQLFQAQMNLAKKLNLPLLVHCRDDRTKNPENSEAWDETVEMTKSHIGIYHCYSGLPSTTNHILQTTNFLISFTANITYPKNEYLREAAKIIPLDRIVLETDCPFLSPQSKRGQRNEPANVAEVAQIVADVKGLTMKEVATTTSNNVAKLFNLR